jgi:hypothetical protein
MYQIVWLQIALDEFTTLCLQEETYSGNSHNRTV